MLALCPGFVNPISIVKSENWLGIASVVYPGQTHGHTLSWWSYTEGKSAVE